MVKMQHVLTQELINFLQGERIVTLVTIDKETNKPTANAISWLRAQPDGKTIKFAIAHKASSGKNIEFIPYVVLNVIGPESCYEIAGKGSISETFDGTMKYKVVTIEIETVQDVIFYGGKIITVPAYEKTYNPELAKKLDIEIYEKLG